MRISGKDECLDSESVILSNPIGHRLGGSNQSGAGTAADQSNASPKVRADFQGGSAAIASVEFLQSNHSLLTGGVVSSYQLLGGGNGLIGQTADQLFGVLPCLRLSFADDQVEADAKTKLAAPFSGCLAGASNFLRHLSRRFAPGEIIINMLRRDFHRRIGRSAKIERRIRLVKRWIEYLCAANL